METTELRAPSTSIWSEVKGCIPTIEPFANLVFSTKVWPTVSRSKTDKYDLIKYTRLTIMNLKEFRSCLFYYAAIIVFYFLCIPTKKMSKFSQTRKPDPHMQINGAHG